MPVHTVWAPSHDDLRAELRDLLPDPLRDLLRVGLVHTPIGVVPQVDPADGQCRCGLLELARSDLGEVLPLGADRLSTPARLATCGADEVDRDAGARVPQDQAPAA